MDENVFVVCEGLPYEGVGVIELEIQHQVMFIRLASAAHMAKYIGLTGVVDKYAMDFDTLYMLKTWPYV